jgi:hypothetical protein
MIQFDVEPAPAKIVLGLAALIEMTSRSTSAVMSRDDRLRPLTR